MSSSFVTTDEATDSRIDRQFENTLRELKDLEQSKQDLVEASETRAQTLKQKIRHLETCNTDLSLQDLQAKLREKDQHISEVSESSNAQDVKLLYENAQLKQTVDKLKSKLASQMSHQDYQDWIQTLYGPQKASETLKDVERFLTRSRKPNCIDQSVQSDPDPMAAEYELKIIEIKAEMKSKHEQLLLEKSINVELGKSLEQLRKEMDDLEGTFTTITNDVQVAKAAEALAKRNLQSAMDTISSLERQNESNIKQLRENEQQLWQFQKAKSVLHTMQTGLPGLHPPKKPSVGDLDPVGMLEYQWMVDRERYNMEIEVVANHSIAQDEIKRHQEELRTRDGVISLLEADDSENTLKQKNIKDLKQRLRSIKEECERKDEVIQQYKLRLLDAEKGIEQLESKVRLLNNLQTTKETTIQNQKARLELLESYALNNEANEEQLNQLQKEAKQSKQDLQRKSEVLKKHKIRAIALENELKELKKSPSLSIDPKSMDTLRAHLRTTRERAKEMEKFLKKYEDREKQYMNAIGIRPKPDPLMPISPDLNQNDFLQLDWDTVKQLSMPVQITLAHQNVKQVLKKDSFEQDLVDILISLIA
ncbi:hypothetical protein EDD86DRAFT_245947 [Gorgonomyces haynaldii]|nr:hypothetical protein EDD86DRAFT_245947 [Gorgonomyces haynaldii]